MFLDVRDHIRTTGVQELIKHLTHLAKKRGLLEFTAEVLIGISRSFTLLDEMGLTSRREMNSGCTRLG